MADKYLVLGDSELLKLEMRVNLLFDEGFRPLGGIAVVNGHEQHSTTVTHCFYQAMIKTEPEIEHDGT